MAGLPNSSNALQQWNHLFEAEGAKRSPQAQQHLQQLLRTGLPTRKHENWKYTPLDGLTNSQFVSIAGEIAPQQRVRRRAAGVCRWTLRARTERCN